MADQIRIAARSSCGTWSVSAFGKTVVCGFVQALMLCLQSRIGLFSIQICTASTTHTRIVWDAWFRGSTYNATSWSVISWIHLTLLSVMTRLILPSNHMLVSKIMLCMFKDKMQMAITIYRMMTNYMDNCNYDYIRANTYSISLFLKRKMDWQIKRRLPYPREVADSV